MKFSLTKGFCSSWDLTKIKTNAQPGTKPGANMRLWLVRGFYPLNASVQSAAPVQSAASIQSAVSVQSAASVQSWLDMSSVQSGGFCLVNGFCPVRGIFISTAAGLHATAADYKRRSRAHTPSHGGNSAEHNYSRNALKKLPPPLLLLLLLPKLRPKTEYGIVKCGSVSFFFFHIEC